MIWVNQPGALTIVIPVDPRKEHELRCHLEDAGRKGSALLEKLATIESIHFARFVLLPAETHDATFGPMLAFESNHDDERGTQLERLVDALGTELHDILMHCIGYDEIRAERVGPTDASPPTAEERQAFLLRHATDDVFPYRAHPNITAAQIKKDIRLKDALSTFVRSEPKLRTLDDKAVFEAVKVHAAELKEQGYDIDPHPRKLPSVFGFYARVVALGLLLVAVCTVVLQRQLDLGAAGTLLAALGSGSFFYSLYLGFRELVIAKENEERADAEASRQRMMDEGDKRMEGIFYSEDRQTQNPLTHLVAVKGDETRQFILGVMLLAVKLMAATLYVHGKLGPIDSIHCARWIRINDGKRLLFFSNYDGSWESYLGEFVDKLSYWLTAVWSNTEDFPTTKNMFEAGAEDEEWFKRWTRQHQLYTQVWYSAYPNTSVQNVIANAVLREGLSKNLADQELRAWLRML